MYNKGDDRVRKTEAVTKAAVASIEKGGGSMKPDDS
jgi:hypothetical protein